MAKNNYKSFVDAIRARGGAHYLDLGGTPAPVNLQPTVVQSPQQNLTQGGLGSLFTQQNQYQAQLAPTQQLNYGPVIGQAAGQALAGYGQLQGNIGQQQALENQFLNQANGQGPNPAQAQLAQNTAANVAQQGALQAGQRGAAGNVGLMARQIGQQGAATQQNAAGQAATLQAQQQLAAQQATAQQQATIGSEINQQQGLNNQLFGTGAGALNTQNAGLVQNYAQQQALNQATAADNAKAANNSSGGILGGLASMITGPLTGAIGGGLTSLLGGGAAPVGTAGETGALSASKAGLMAKGGEVSPPPQNPISSGFNQATGASGVSQAVKNVKNYDAGGAVNGPRSMVGQFLTSNGKMPATQPMAKGGMPKVVSGEMLAAKGMSVPGQAKVKGDSLKNDNVPAMLSPGEIVIPRHITQGPNAAANAAKFVQAIQAKQSMKRKK